MPDSLSKKSIKYGTDKGPLKHDFCDVYEKKFCHYQRDKDPNFKMLEIGVATGSSIRMWLNHFVAGEIYGLDVKECGLRNERFRFFKGNQRDEKVLHEIVKKAKMFDIIIDDGSHDTFDMSFCFSYLFKYIKPGGLYCIEDLDYKKCPKMAKNMIRLEEQFVYDDEYIVENVEFCKNYITDKGHLCIIKKRIFDCDVNNLTEQYESIDFNSLKPIPLEFTTTATIRPEIHEKTFSSFRNKLQGVNFKSSILYLNIDPLPVDRTDQVNDCIAVAQKYFGTVVSHAATIPNLSQAYNWAWSQCKGKFIFNLEDDWELVRDANIHRLLWFFTANPKLYQVILRAYSYIYPACCLSPGISHERFYRRIAGKLFKNKNPENQIHHHGADFGLDFPFRANGINPIERVVAYPFPDKNLQYASEDLWLMVKDLGREWMKKSGYKLPIKKNQFVTWDKKMKIEIFTCISRGSSPYALLLKKSLETFKSNKHQLIYKFIESNNSSGLRPVGWDMMCSLKDSGHNSLNHGIALNQIKNYIEADTDIIIIMDADIVILLPNWDDITTQLLEQYLYVSWSRPKTKYAGIFFFACHNSDIFKQIDFRPKVILPKETICKQELSKEDADFYNMKPHNIIKCDTGYKIPLVYGNMGFNMSCVLANSDNAKLFYHKVCKEKPEHMAEWHYNGKLFGTHKQASRNHPLNSSYGEIWKKRIDIFTRKEFGIEL